MQRHYVQCACEIGGAIFMSFHSAASCADHSYNGAVFWIRIHPHRTELSGRRTPSICGSIPDT